MSGNACGDVLGSAREKISGDPTEPLTARGCGVAAGGDATADRSIARSG